MRWKNWSYWLRGGLIGIITFILLFIVSIPINVKTSFPVSSFSYYFPMIPLVVLSKIFPESIKMFLGEIAVRVGGAWVFGVLINFMLIFLMGSLIGFLYGKIKNRKQEVKKWKI